MFLKVRYHDQMNKGYSMLCCNLLKDSKVQIRWSSTKCNSKSVSWTWSQQAVHYPDPVSRRLSSGRLPGHKLISQLAKPALITRKRLILKVLPARVLIHLEHVGQTSQRPSAGLPDKIVPGRDRGRHGPQPLVL